VPCREGLALLLTLGLTASPGAAKATPDDTPAEKRLDLAVPDIPAFTALGVSPSTVSRPDQLKELATAIVSGLSPAGQVQSGVAAEVSPQQLLRGGQRGPVKSDLLAGLRLSAATNAAAATPASRTAVALAARFSYGGYVPAADPLLQSCLLAALTPGGGPIDVSEIPGPPPAPSALPAAPPVVTVADEWQIVSVPALAACRALFRAAHLADFAAEAAYVHTWEAIGAPEVDNFHNLTDTLWLSLTGPVWRTFGPAELEALRGAALAATHADASCRSAPDLEEARRQSRPCAERHRAAWAAVLERKAWQSARSLAPIVFLRFDSRRLAPDDAARQIDLYFAARVPFITDGWSLFAEGGYRFVDVSGRSPAPLANAAPVGVGGDVRLANGTWFALYAGVDVVSGAIFSLGNIKWSLGEKRPL